MTVTVFRSAGTARSRRERRQDARWDERRAALLVQRWRRAAHGAGLTADTQSCAGIPGVVAPDVLSVVLDDPARLLVRMLPAQLLSDYERAAARLAEGLGVPHVRVQRRSTGYLWIELLSRDPLASAVTDLAGSTAADLVLGRTDRGVLLAVQLATLAHVIVQGQTRSGKSRFLYGLLGQLVGRPDVLLCGSDVTGILLRPMLATRHRQYLAVGSGQITDHADVLESLVGVMDDRIARMPTRADVFPCNAAEPYLAVVLEELPGLLKAAAAVDATSPPARGTPKLAARIQAAYGRLLAEGAKVGFRLILVAQRADATIIGGFERAQCPLHISFTVDTIDAIRMLHPAVDDATALQHITAPAGRALVSGPGLPLTRMRSPEMGDYGVFVDQVAAVAGPAVDESTEE